MREKFLMGAENAVRSKPRDDDALEQERVRRRMQKVAELALEKDVLREAIKNRPFVLFRRTCDSWKPDTAC